MPMWTGWCWPQFGAGLVREMIRMYIRAPRAQCTEGAEGGSRESCSAHPWTQRLRDLIGFAQAVSHGGDIHAF